MTFLRSTYLPRATAGLKPGSGRVFHLGNYFGTLRKVIDAQEKWPGQNFLFVADLHTLIHTAGKSVSRAEVYALVKGCLHLGVDPAKTCIYLQSEIPELMHFMWQLACASANPKDKAPRERGHASHYLYDTLMAADILGLRASDVSVGGDLDREVQYCRRLAESMNLLSRTNVLPLPNRMLGNGDQDNVPGVDGARMSFSAGNYVPIFERISGETDDAIDRIGEAVGTGTDGGSAASAGDPALRLLKLLQPETATPPPRGARASRGESLRNKGLLKSSLREFFREARASHDGDRYRDSEVDDVLEAGRVRVRAEYRETLSELQL